MTGQKYRRQKYFNFSKISIININRFLWKMKISGVIPCERLGPGCGAVLQWPRHSRQGAPVEELRAWSEPHSPHCLYGGGHRGAGAPSERCHWSRSCWWSWGRECQSCWPSTSWPRISQPEPSSLTWTGPCLPPSSWNIRTLKYFHMNKVDLMRISKALGSTSVTVIILMFLANGPCNIALPKNSVTTNWTICFQNDLWNVGIFLYVRQSSSLFLKTGEPEDSTMELASIFSVYGGLPICIILHYILIGNISVLPRTLCPFQLLTVWPVLRAAETW